MNNIYFCLTCKKEFRAKKEDLYGTGELEWNKKCPTCQSELDVYQQSPQEKKIVDKQIAGMYEQDGEIVLRFSDHSVVRLYGTINQEIKIQTV